MIQFALLYLFIYYFFLFIFFFRKYVLQRIHSSYLFLLTILTNSQRELTKEKKKLKDYYQYVYFIKTKKTKKYFSKVCRVCDFQTTLNDMERISNIFM